MSHGSAAPRFEATRLSSALWSRSEDLRRGETDYDANTYTFDLKHHRVCAICSELGLELMLNLFPVYMCLLGKCNKFTCPVSLMPKRKRPGDLLQPGRARWRRKGRLMNLAKAHEIGRRPQGS